MSGRSSSACSRRPRSITPRRTINGDWHDKVSMACLERPSLHRRGRLTGAGSPPGRPTPTQGLRY
jgi:hypothetical protein